jgi:hypothetical protein
MAKKKLKNPYKTQVNGAHYKKENKIDLADFLIQHEIGYAEGNIMKYVYRHKDKNGLEDIQKAKHYLEFIAFTYYGANID